jgi:hypothetical protein
VAATTATILRRMLKKTARRLPDVRMTMTMMSRMMVHDGGGTMASTVLGGSLR